jgi:hypothetical protein
MKRPSQKAITLVVGVACLAVVAGVFAVRAFANTDYYCNGCTLGSTPAVSDSEPWYDNEIYTGANNADEQIYMYNTGTGVQSCSAAADNVDYIDNPCSPPGGAATARCHLLHGTGPYSAICDASAYI